MEESPYQDVLDVSCNRILNRLFIAHSDFVTDDGVVENEALRDRILREQQIKEMYMNLDYRVVSAIDERPATTKIHLVKILHSSDFVLTESSGW